MPAPHGFYWVDKSRIAGLARPHSVADLQWLRSQGLDILVSLTEDPIRRDWANEAGLLVVHVPIEDMAPPTMEQLTQIMMTIDRAQANRMGVAVHCAAGLGRTGTVAAAVLVNKGMAAGEAIEKVRKLRPGSIETERQEEAVQEFARLRRSAQSRTEPRS